MTGLLYDVQRQPFEQGPQKTKAVTMLANGWQCFLLKVQMVNVRDQHRVSSTSMLLGPSKGPVHVASMCKLNHVLLDSQMLYDGQLSGLWTAHCNLMHLQCHVQPSLSCVIQSVVYQITHVFL